MDRASFLRSLPYLRQLPPSVWNHCCIETATSSCSTASPPTPRSENDLAILLDEGFAVSIEPIYRGASRKRGRNDDRSITGRPAFFHHFKKEMEPMEPPDIVNVAKRKDDEEDKLKDALNDKENKPKDTLSHEINNDPAMCSFEVAIIKRRRIFSSSVLGMHCQKKDALTTPNARTTTMDIDEDDTDDMYDLHSKILLFRFGNYFVFEANPSAIVNLEHQYGYGDGDKNQGDDETTALSNGEKQKQLVGQIEESEVTKIGDDSHQSKRQCTDRGTSDASIKRLCPASLCISFPSCTFRVFSVENCKESNTSKGSSALNTPGDPGNRLLNAQNKIFQQFDLNSREASHWGSSAFDIIESENWSCCLDSNHKPVQKVSPTKTDSSSTHFENGQKQLSDPKAIENNDSDPNIHDSDDVGGPGKHLGDDILDERKSGQQKSPEDSIRQKDLKTDVTMDASKVKDDTDGNLSNNISFMSEISNKRSIFDHSWSLMQASASNSATSSLLTSCAETLNHSYCSLKQHTNFAHQCDMGIDSATSEVETLLEEMRPVRGKNISSSKLLRSAPLQSDTSAEQDVDLEQRINALLRLRKAAVAAKYSLFLVPQK